MKQLFVICALAATFASCGNSETTNTSASDSTVVTAAAPIDTVAVVDSTVAATDSVK